VTKCNLELIGRKIRRASFYKKTPFYLYYWKSRYRTHFCIYSVIA